MYTLYIYVHGLFLEGARFDGLAAQLDESEPKVGLARVCSVWVNRRCTCTTSWSTWIGLWRLARRWAASSSR